MGGAGGGGGGGGGSDSGINGANCSAKRGSSVSGSPEAGKNHHSSSPPSSCAAASAAEDGCLHQLLTPSNYGAFFTKLVLHEIATENQTVQTHNMYNVPVVLHDAAQCLVQVFVPGIRENVPTVQLGDMIRLRQIRPSLLGYPSVFTGYEYEAFVYGMDRSVGYLILRADGLWIENGGKFNVIFGVQERRWDGPRRAVADVGSCLQAQLQEQSEKKTKDHQHYDHNNKQQQQQQQQPQHQHQSPASCSPISTTMSPMESIDETIMARTPSQQSSFLRRMLFPEHCDGKMQYGLTRGVFERQWIDKELNYEQVSC